MNIIPFDNGNECVVNCRKEPYDIMIDRSSIWGNPYKIGKDGTREYVIELYRAYVLNNSYLMSQLFTLKNKRLGCWCKPKLCHGDVLIDLVRQYT